MPKREFHQTSAPPESSPGSGADPRDHCETGELFAMLGRPHMLRLLSAFRDARGKPLRFSALQSRLGVSPKTLSERLRVLVNVGFVVRRSYRELPPRVEYEITAKGAELDELFEVLGRWASHHSMSSTAARRGSNGPPT